MSFMSKDPISFSQLYLFWSFQQIHANKQIQKISLLCFTHSFQEDLNPTLNCWTITWREKVAGLFENHTIYVPIYCKVVLHEYKRTALWHLNLKAQVMLHSSWAINMKLFGKFFLMNYVHMYCDIQGWPVLYWTIF